MWRKDILGFWGSGWVLAESLRLLYSLFIYSVPTSYDRISSLVTHVIDGTASYFLGELRVENRLFLIVVIMLLNCCFYIFQKFSINIALVIVDFEVCLQWHPYKLFLPALFFAQWKKLVPGLFWTVWQACWFPWCECICNYAIWWWFSFFCFQKTFWLNIKHPK